ncbi:hypothetical protein AA0472_0599 [Acetobacter estunensis NRIC 0472]|nr:hypothetical protein AA0472_0599 [Acetobacter estunensis NRIC 0472]
MGVQDARFIHVLRVENGNGAGTRFPLLFQRVFRDMIFGVFDIPAECESLRLTAQMPGKMFSLRLGDGKWEESVAVEKAEMTLLSSSAA